MRNREKKEALVAFTWDWYCIYGGQKVCIALWAQGLWLRLHKQA